MRASAAAALFLLAGCAAPVAWEKPGADEARRDLDLAECASLARNEMRSHRELATERPPPDPGREDSSALRRMREAGAQDRREALIADCMGAKGYAARRT